MKKYSLHLTLFFVLTFLINLNLLAQAPTIKWDKTIGGSSNDVLRSIQQTTDGGYILGGYSESGISGDKTEANLSQEDYWVVKLSIEPSGSGTSGDPYLIATLQDLEWVSKNPDSWDKYFLQTADIVATATSGWDSGDGFSPIGDASTNFTGSYDGQDFTIDGLFINRTDEEQGLFGFADGATIQNLGVNNVDITADYFIGGLLGYGTGCTVVNCYSTGNVNANATGMEIGGLVGVNYDHSLIDNCWSSATVSSEGGTVGGLVGRSEDISEINNCYSTGDVSGAGNVGGLVGYNYDCSEINNCYSTGNVSGEENVGGFVGYNSDESEINNSYSRGNVIEFGVPDDIGGFCGSNRDGTIKHCYSTGSVTKTGGTDPTDQGFLGDDNGECYYANNFWDMETSAQSSNTGGGATGKTIAEMKDVATFTDNVTVGLSLPVWDFKGNPNDDIANEDYWEIGSGSPAKVRGAAAAMAKNDGYPYLSWQVFDGTSFPRIQGQVTDQDNYGIEGVNISFTNGAIATITDPDGNYGRSVPMNWSGTATPNKGGLNFTPSSRIYSNVTAHQYNQDYTTVIPNLVRIYGTVLDSEGNGMEGVEIDFTNGAVTVYTKADGSYWRAIPVGYSGTATPIMAGYSFEPNSRTYSSLSANIYDQDYTGSDGTLAVADINALPVDFTVLPAYPNPFNPSTTISYGLDCDSYVTINIYDITGQLISTLQNNRQLKGWHSIIWNGTNKYGDQVPAGLYLGRITSDNDVKTTKLMLLK